MRKLGRVSFCVLLLFLAAASLSILSGCGSSSSSPTASYVGTQSPGDYWTWAETTNSSGQVSFTAADVATGLTYSGSETALSGNSSGITALTVTSSTDPSIQSSLPAPAYEINVPNTMVMAAVPPFETVQQPVAKMVSEQGPVVAAAQGSCPANGTTTNVDWIMMPRANWCPTASATFVPTDYQGNYTTCTAASDAYGTASIAVDANGNYTLGVTAYYMNGTKDTSATAPVLSSCSCNSGVVQCTDNNNKPVKIAFTPSGIFIMDTANYGVAGVVQSNINASGFYASGNAFKGMSFWSFDNPGPPAVPQQEYIPETAPASMTTNGTGMTFYTYANIDAGTLSTSSTSVSFNNPTQVAPGLITTTFTNCDSNSYPMAIALTNINGKYVAFAVGYSPGQGPGKGTTCPDYTHGFNVLAVQQ